MKTVLDLTQCKKIGKVIRPIKLKEFYYKRDFLAFPADLETKMRAYLYSVAVCHQTHTLINKKQNLVGWDYIEYAFANLAKNEPQLLEPGHIAASSTQEMVDVLKSVFSDDENPENCTLDRLEERANFIISIGKIIRDKYDSKVANMIRLSQSLLFNEGNGLYKLLEELPPYKDPLKKKSTVFIKLLDESGLALFKDFNKVEPVMDYHMQRVLLRMGCVEVLDEQLKTALIDKKKLESEMGIRDYCAEAIKVIAETSNYKITKMDDFFWSLGRSCCKDKTLCYDKECNKSPCTFESIVDLPKHDDCIFNRVCKGSSDKEHRSYWQPMVETTFY